MNTLLCKACNKTFEYTPKEYGGFSNELQGNLDKTCWGELQEIKTRHGQEIQDWVNSKKGAK